jgi:hypothetical protein
VETFYNVFKKRINFFCPQKVEKNNLKSCPEKLKSTFFFLTAIPLPAQPKQKNSCSKMWPIDQLYIDTQLRHKSKKSKNLGLGVDFQPCSEDDFLTGRP